MLRRLFPRQIDNAYQGQRMGLWLLAPIVFVNMVMGANTMINTRSVIEGADAIPLDAYPAAAAAVIVTCFKNWGLGHLTLATLGLLALIRYRSMAPLVFLVLGAENIGRLLLLVTPTELLSPNRWSTGIVINLTLVVVLIVGFAFSMIARSDCRRPKPSVGKRNR